MVATGEVHTVEDVKERVECVRRTGIRTSHKLKCAVESVAVTNILGWLGRNVSAVIEGSKDRGLEDGVGGSSADVRSEEGGRKGTNDLVGRSRLISDVVAFISCRQVLTGKVAGARISHIQIRPSLADDANV